MVHFVTGYYFLYLFSQGDFICINHEKDVITSRKGQNDARAFSLFTSFPSHGHEL